MIFFREKGKRFLTDNSTLFFIAVDFFLKTCFEKFDSLSSRQKHHHHHNRLHIIKRYGHNGLLYFLSVSPTKANLCRAKVHGRAFYCALRRYLPEPHDLFLCLNLLKHYGYDYKRTSYTESGISLLRPSMPKTPFTSE